jgi:hypothetical protein
MHARVGWHALDPHKVPEGDDPESRGSTIWLLAFLGWGRG